MPEIIVETTDNSAVVLSVAAGHRGLQAGGAEVAESAGELPAELTVLLGESAVVFVGGLQPLPERSVGRPLPCGDRGIGGTSSGGPWPLDLSS